MNAQQSRAKSIFLNALGIAAVPQRQAYVAAECAGDEGLRREVDQLLRHFEGIGSFMKAPVNPSALVAGSPDHPTTGGESATTDGGGEGSGTVIGPYKLLET